MIAAAITLKLKVEPTRRAYCFTGGVSVAAKRNSVTFQTFKVPYDAGAESVALGSVPPRKWRLFVHREQTDRCAKLLCGSAIPSRRNLIYLRVCKTKPEILFSL